MTKATGRSTCDVIGTAIDVLDWDAAVARIIAWSRKRVPKVVCICNSHSLVTAGSDRLLKRALENADMATADGAPVAWLMRRMGHTRQDRINGPDLMWRCLAAAEVSGVGIYLYGGSTAVLRKLVDRIMVEFPRLDIAGFYSPPYRDLTTLEEEAAMKAIRDSQAGIVWVGLGCPRQEKWMQERRGIVNAVMIGVGAAFDYHAGTLRRAPLWMQRHGLEWAYRLASEPRRLWRRYFATNSLFIYRAAQQLMSSKLRT